MCADDQCHYIPPPPTETRARLDQQIAELRAAGLEHLIPQVEAEAATELRAFDEIND